MDARTSKQLSPSLPFCSLEHQVNSLTVPPPSATHRASFEASLPLPNTTYFPLSMDVAVGMGSGMLPRTVGVKDLAVIPPRSQCGPDLELTGRKIESASI